MSLSLGSGGKMKEKCNIHKDFHKDNARFYKTLTGDFAHSTSLPEKFISDFQKTLPEVISLEGPGGDKWHVGLVTIGNNVFLKFGWKEFLEAHKVEENATLLFEFDGDSSFTVKIFDLTECEMESSYFVKNEQLEQESEESSQFKSNTGQCAEPNTGPEPSFSRRETRKGKEIPTPECEAEEKSAENETSEHRRKPSSNESKPRKRGKTFKTSGPSFSVVMKPYFIGAGKKFVLLIPTDFAIKYFPRDAEMFTITLRIPNEKTKWKVNCSTSNSYRLLGNWRTFVRDNDLKAGDECVFELLKGKKHLTMAVHIIRTEVAPSA